MYKVINIITTDNVVTPQYDTFYKDVNPDFDLSTLYSSGDYVIKSQTPDNLRLRLENEGWTEACTWNGYNIRNVSSLLDESTIEVVSLFYRNNRPISVVYEDYNRYTSWGESVELFFSGGRSI